MKWKFSDRYFKTDLSFFLSKIFPKWCEKFIATDAKSVGVSGRPLSGRRLLIPGIPTKISKKSFEILDLMTVVILWLAAVAGPGGDGRRENENRKRVYAMRCRRFFPPIFRL